MTRPFGRLCLLGLVAASACSSPPPSPPPHVREDTLARAFAARISNPMDAAALFEQAGSGATLERARLEAWLSCLERARPTPDRWQAFLATHPPGDLRHAALEGLGRARLGAGDLAGGIAALDEAGQAGRLSADETLVTQGDAAARNRAAERLVVCAPQRLRRLDPVLERSILKRLEPAQWLARAGAWRRVGAPARAVEELRRQRWSGPEEQRRVDEMTAAAIAAGQPSWALAAMPRSAAQGGQEETLRADLLRRQAWDLVPQPAAQQLFARCVAVAERAAAAGAGGVRRQALALVLECGTESGRLEPALAAWRRLLAESWDDPRRDWLGRRLGLALAARAGRDREVDEVAAGVPDHRRCLRYWLARGEGGRAAARDRLSQLAQAPYPDLYATWAREDLGLPPPAPLSPGTATRHGAVPLAVARLLDWGAPDLAVREWRRLRRLRALAPAEAVAAARLELDQGDRNEAIACLRSALPELGRVDMDHASATAIRLYLPLAWDRSLVSAAASVGLDPWLLAAVVRQESLFNPTAVSPAGARGLLQLLPGTARPHALALGLGPRPDLFDPDHNLRLGARELAAMLRRFGAVEPALAAYNAGESRAQRWWRQWPDRRRFTEAVPIPETYNYIRRVTYLAEAYRLVYGLEWRVR